MHVRKFEADSLEEALGNIKSQLGPDAIILKTVTNKGLKGAFKKKKIEITAAISEKNYVRKAKVDSAITSDNKEQFYANSSSYISNIIDDYDSHNPSANKQSTGKAGYGSLGINKQVMSAKDIGSKLKSGLDDFLSLGHKEDERVQNITKDEYKEEQLQAPVQKFSRKKENEEQLYQSGVELVGEELEEFNFDESSFDLSGPEKPSNEQINNHINPDIQNKIDELEKQIFMLNKSFEKIEHKEAVGIYQLRTTLTSLDVSPKFIQGLIRKALFELSEEEVMDIDFVFEFALREMNNCIQIDMPLFSSVDSDYPVLTVFISESEVGQTKMAHKVGALRTDSILIKNFKDHSLTTKKDSFCEKMLNIEVVNTDGIAQIVSECRKAVDNKQSVFIDYKSNCEDKGDTKAFIDGLRRSFKNVEVLLSISSINTELYNRKIAARYRSLANGMIISNIDLCLNFGALFNICDEYPELPLKFFGTGEVVPDDLEAATSERILAGLFEL